MKEEVKNKLLAQLSPKIFELILFPTEQCNFRCTYCYEDFEIGRMTSEVIEGVKELINKNSKVIKILSLSWFGGEPLLALNTVLEITKYANSLRHVNGMSVNGSMTTNGYLLTQDIAKKLIDQGVRKFQISLDGLEEGHNKTRKLVNGNGSFNVIWKNLTELKNSDFDFEIIIRLHITPQNIDSVYELAEVLKSDFLSDKRFSIFVKPVKNLGGPNATSIEALNREDAFIQTKRILELVGPNSEASEDIYVCYAAKPNSYVIRADGRVQKCTVALDSQHNTLGNLTIDGKLNLDHSKLKGWMRGFEFGNRGELHCPATNFPKHYDENDVQVLEVK